MPAIILADSGWTGSLEMSSFQGLSGGKTCEAARILSASGVLNITGLVISGILGRSPPWSLAANWQGHPSTTAITTRGEIRFMEGGLDAKRDAGKRWPKSYHIAPALEA